ncbi:MAG: diguanylate cyclase, partial [Clostridia bacterium]|nr:diguanylate cyclase [Clostridia bacterium]
DLLASLLRGESFTGVDFLLYATNALSLSGITAAGYAWLLYGYVVLTNKEISSKFKILSAIPMAIMVAMIFSAPLNRRILSITSDHFYERGNYIWVHWVVSYPYLFAPTIYATFKAIKERGKNRDTIAIILFIIAPLITSVMQVLFYGLTGLPVGIALACLIIYLMIQNQQIHLDSLTNVYNRVGLNKKLEELFKGKNRPIYSIIVDVDNFKSINDTYGYKQGDLCLSLTADALKKAASGLEEDIFIARYSSTSFMILGIDTNNDAHFEIERLIKAEINAVNNLNSISEPISVSMGTVYGILSDFEDEEELIEKTNSLMLADKESHNKRNRYNVEVKDDKKERTEITSQRATGTHRLDVKPNELNKSVLYLWMVIVIVLAVTYLFEVLKGARTVEYYCVFMAVTAIPWLVCLIVYTKNPNSIALRYLAPVGYMIMYVFVMFTGSTNLVFSYVLVFMALLVLYHQPSLVAGYGIVGVLANIAFILVKYQKGEVHPDNLKDFEIQIALLSLCFIGGYVATTLYGRVTRANQVYIEDLHQSNEKIKNVAIDSISTIANTIDAKDEYTRGHSQRVAIYSKMLAKEVGLSDEIVENIYSIGLLHDIGKIGVPDSILNKPGKLTFDEYKILQNHTVVGANILSDFDSIQGIDIGTRYHHERYDGKGYPEGLKGEEIPIIARIIAVADSFDAMTSDRVYRNKLTREEVTNELVKGLGTQFDATIGQIMLNFYKEGKVPVTL